MNQIRMEVLLEALAALQVAEKQMRADITQPWLQVMNARIALQVELNCLPALEIKPAEVAP